MLLKKPKEVGWVEAGGIPENWMTGKLTCGPRTVEGELMKQLTKPCSWRVACKKGKTS
jgi:hypothetical protein